MSKVYYFIETRNTQEWLREDGKALTNDPLKAMRFDEEYKALLYIAIILGDFKNKTWNHAMQYLRIGPFMVTEHMDFPTEEEIKSFENKK